MVAIRIFSLPVAKKGTLGHFLDEFGLVADFGYFELTG